MRQRARLVIKLRIAALIGGIAGCGNLQDLPGNLPYALGVGDEKFIFCDDKGLNCRALSDKERLAEGEKHAARTKELREQQARERAKQFADSQAREKAREQRLAEARQKQIQEDEAKGYKHLSFNDFHLDHKSLPLGSKVAITGYYRASGSTSNQSEILASNFLPNALEVILITDKASRGARQLMLTCRSHLDARSMVCPLTIFARVSKCEVSYLGRRISTDVCLAVEAARTPT